MRQASQLSANPAAGTNDYSEASLAELCGNS